MELVKTCFAKFSSNGNSNALSRLGVFAKANEVLRAVPNEVKHGLAHLSNEDLVNRMISIAPMSASFEDRFRKSEITGFMFESFTESILSSIDIHGEFFSPVEVSLLLNYQKRLQRSTYLEEKLVNSRQVMISEITPGTNASLFAYTFTGETSVASFLKDRNLLSLARINEIGIREEIKDFFLLESNGAYFCVPKVADFVFDIEKEVRGMLNVIRTRADYSAKRNIEDYYRINVNFKGNDIKIKNFSGADEGDIDTLFVSDHMHFLVERKRTIGNFDEIYNRIICTQKGYKTYVLDVAGIECKLVSMLYSESINEDTAQKLLEKGVHVIQDSMECRFISDPSYKKFMRLK